MYFTEYVEQIIDGTPTDQIEMRSRTLPRNPTAAQRIQFFQFIVNAFDEYTFTNQSMEAYLNESGLGIQRAQNQGS